MTVSILLPSISPELGTRAIQSILDTTQGLDIEIVLVAPYKYSHPLVLSVEEPKQQGCVKAYRTAYQSSTGDFVIPLPDDWLTPPFWLHRLLNFFSAHEPSDHTPYCCGLPVWGRFGNAIGTVFGRYYPYTPLCRRTSVEKIGGFYHSDFVGSWADPDIALRIWNAGGRCDVCLDSFLVAASNRSKYPEGPHKYSHFDRDYLTFSEKWHPIFGSGWGTSPTDVNFNVPTSLVQHETVLVPSYVDFHSLLTSNGIESPPLQ